MKEVTQRSNFRVYLNKDQISLLKEQLGVRVLSGTKELKILTQKKIQKIYQLKN